MKCLCNHKYKFSNSHLWKKLTQLNFEKHFELVKRMFEVQQVNTNLTILAKLQLMAVVNGLH